MTNGDYLRAISDEDSRNLSVEEFRAMSTDALRPSKETLEIESDTADPSRMGHNNSLLSSRGHHFRENLHRKQRSLSRSQQQQQQGQAHGRPRAKAQFREPPTVNHGRNGSREALSGEGPGRTLAFANGYHFPPKYPLREKLPLAIIDLWNFYNTGFGFFLVMYAINVVEWGGLLFLLYCNASPAMCTPSCEDPNSPRQRWIENSSQVLNALLCVLGFGLAPWRLRDLYYLLRIRLFDDHRAKRRFAAVHRNWFRLPGSENLPPALGPKNVEEMVGTFDRDAVPLPIDDIPDAPLTGVRAPPTRMYRVDLICWFMIANTGLQCCLASLLWALSRHERPEWASGVFVVLACTANATGSILTAKEGRIVRAVEGIPLRKRDRKRLVRDQELGIPHYNNVHDKPNQEPGLQNKDTLGWVQSWGFGFRERGFTEKLSLDYRR